LEKNNLYDIYKISKEEFIKRVKKYVNL